MNTREVIKKYQRYVLPNYSKTGLVIVRAKGSWVWDAEGKKYLDFFPGWGVSLLGHCHPFVVRAIQDQARRILHVSNNYSHPWQAELAGKISKASFGGLVFFCNSGAEAVEAAIKLARRWGNLEAGGRYEIIAMQNSFHGRTLAAVSATGQRKHQEGFEPLVEGFRHVPFNDLRAVEQAVTSKTVAVMIEPIQGEGGINVATREFLQGVRKLCDQRRLLLILDEVQTGMGRTGKMFAYEHYGIKPDVMTLAKSLGGGTPIGAMVVKRSLADVLKPGTHAATYGGNPLVTRAGLAFFEAIERERLLQRVPKLGEKLKKRLEQLAKKFLVIREVRGKGMMIGIELVQPGKWTVEECMRRGLLINCTQDRILRMLPALTIKEQELEKGLEIFEEALATT